MKATKTTSIKKQSLQPKKQRSRFSEAEIAALTWAWHITWRQSENIDVKMRERLRKIIPEKQQPEEERVNGEEWEKNEMM